MIFGVGFVVCMLLPLHSQQSKHTYSNVLPLMKPTSVKVDHIAVGCVVSWTSLRLCSVAKFSLLQVAVQSYLPGGASVHSIYYIPIGVRSVPVLPPAVSL